VLLVAGTLFAAQVAEQADSLRRYASLPREITVAVSPLLERLALEGRTAGRESPLFA
jgi:hypothetical protein